MKKPLLLCALCVALSAALLIWGLGSPPAQQPERQAHYVLIIENDTGTFLLQLRKGLEAAAGEQNARLSLEGAQADPAVQAQGLAAQGVDAVLLLLEDPTPLCAALKDCHIPRIVIGQRLQGEICVTAGDTAGGEALIARALSMAPPARILLITDPDDPRAVLRASGAQPLAQAKQVAEIAWPQAIDSLQGYDVLLACSSRATRALADAKAEGLLPPSILLVGVDTDDQRTVDLENGLVQAMLIDNPYAIGYLALGHARQATHNELGPSVHTCASTLIDPSNMYASENVKLVFPLLQ